jgi:SMODS-associating 2TM, beta-strand rich effector domain
MAHPKRDPESGRPMLYYVYRVVPKNIDPDAGQAYEGSAILKLSNTGINELSGNYFTSRQTKGYFELTR